MRVEHNHAHADTRYTHIGLPDFLNLVSNVLEMKRMKYETLNVHLPFEIQHPAHVSPIRRPLGYAYIFFGELLKRMFRIKLYWENAPELRYGIWDLAKGQSEWRKIPRFIELCLDTGHLMLGAKTVEAARERIRQVLHDRADQIKHLHIHENDLVHDKHWHEWKVIDGDLMKELIKNRTHIFEKGE